MNNPIADTQKDTFGAHGLSAAQIDADDSWKWASWIAGEKQTIAICDRCGTMLAHPCAAINADGIKITIGCDCLEKVLAAHDTLRAKIALSDLAIEQKIAAKSRRDAKKAIANAANAAKFQAIIDRCNVFADDQKFKGEFARSLRAQIINGAKPSEKQLALLAKFESVI